MKDILLSVEMSYNASSYCIMLESHHMVHKRWSPWWHISFVIHHTNASMDVHILLEQWVWNIACISIKSGLNKRICRWITSIPKLNNLHKGEKLLFKGNGWAGVIEAQKVVAIGSQFCRCWFPRSWWSNNKTENGIDDMIGFTPYDGRSLFSLLTSSIVVCFGCCCVCESPLLSFCSKVCLYLWLEREIIRW